MCDHSNVSCHYAITAGEVVLNIHCSDCGLMPPIDAMNALAMTMDFLIKRVVEGQFDWTQKTKASLN